MSNPPTTLGQYQIIREIARSNDIVYEAYDPLMNRRVAIKELSMPHGSSDQQIQDRISRFRREAQAAGTLNHPNIMTVYSFAEDSGRFYMALEYLDGVTLRKEIENHGKLDPERAIEIACDVLEGLACAHENGVIHRDIKPDNVQITSGGIIKITDFGIARLTFQPNLTVDGQVFGTPSYMSPEQVVGRDLDPRSDLWSVGVMLYEMLSGEKPFKGDNVVAISYAITNIDPPQPPGIGPALWPVIAKVLNKAPSQRYASAIEMRDALKQALFGSQKPPQMLLPDPNNFGPTPQAAYQPNAMPPITPYGNVQMPPDPFAPGAHGQQILAPGAIYQTPYQPSGQGMVPPPNYGVQPPPVIAQPPSYGAYNPYQQSVGIPGAANNGFPPGYPVYYPPPPRAPMLKPETKAFLQKFALTFLVVATIFALVFMLFKMATDAIQEKAKANPGRTGIVTSQEVATASAPVAPEKAAPTPEEPVPDDVTLGRQALRENQYLAAATYFRTAIRKAPGRSEGHEGLGDALWSRSLTVQDPSVLVPIWREAGQAWEEAYRLGSNEAGRKAANLAILEAENLAASGASRRAIRELYMKVRVLAPNSQFSEEADKRLAELGA